MVKRAAEPPSTPLRRGARPCPTCGKPATARHQPFCSPRCADVDLGRWLKESYRVPTEDHPEDGATAESED